ncbi:MAG: hypothetical protein FD137_300 [Spirochaetes bacterium]|nr:MAG: hypothetical protein FD137_300 [Spirochaetota bacterium]
MMEKTKLRGADIATSSIFFLLGIYMVAEAFTMPLKDSYAGVDSVWYVSPALMPLIIGGAMILLSVFIFLHAKKEGGLAAFKALFTRREKKIFWSDANMRYAAVLVPLLAMVYINITRIDFFLTIVLYLAFTIPVFYFDDPRVFRSMTKLYSAEMGFFLLLALFGLDKLLNGLFAYSLDLIAFAMIVSIILALLRMGEKYPETVTKKKFAQAMWMTWMTPVFVVPIFRFMLRVPLPVEGAVVNVMSFVYYTVRQ